MVSVSETELICWQNHQVNTFNVIQRIRLPSKDTDKKSVACISDCGTIALVNQGDLNVLVFDVRHGQLIRTFDALESIKENGNSGFVAYNGDIVGGLRFHSETKESFRLYYTRDRSHFFVDVDLDSQVTTMQRAKPFQDRSILAVEGGNIRNLKQMQDSLQSLIDKQLQAGNLLAFPPENEISTAALLNRQDNHFLVHDIRRNNYIRKVRKETSDEAFAIDGTGRFLIFIEG